MGAHATLRFAGHSGGQVAGARVALRARVNPRPSGYEGEGICVLYVVG
jgi:hypothetical protein